MNKPMAASADTPDVLAFLVAAILVFDHVMGFEGFVRITNNSGEQYDDAQVRLVVGRINLVEKIAQLAQVPMSKVAEMEEAKRNELRARVMKKTQVNSVAQLVQLAMTH